MVPTFMGARILLTGSSLTVKKLSCDGVSDNKMTTASLALSICRWKELMVTTGFPGESKAFSIAVTEPLIACTLTSQCFAMTLKTALDRVWVSKLSCMTSKQDWPSFRNGNSDAESRRSQLPYSAEVRI